MARIYRDAHGIPHVRGKDADDVAFGQGAVAAIDRSWQLEWLRRRAVGETAELVGAAGEPWDAFAVRTRLLDTAQRAFDALSTEARAFVASYADGVSSRLDATAPELAQLGVTPHPWPEWMPLAVFHAQHVVFAGLGTRLWQGWSRAVLGDQAGFLGREHEPASGSNAWAVGGARTTSGMPLIGGDPHRNLEAPGVYHQARLACEDESPFDVFGLAFVGVPGIPHFAHAGEVAWAITNGCGDYQDLYEAGEARQPGDLEIERGVWLRYAPTVLGDLGFEALLPLLRARTAAEVDAALDHWVEPVNNAVIADVHGDLRYRLAGRVPVRDADGGWTGWLGDVHRESPGPHGQLVSANERRGPQSAAVGSEFAAPHRARRIAALLDGRDDLGPEDFVAIHNDTWLATVDLLAPLVPGAFDDFDAQMTADSPQAGRFAAWRSELVRLVAEDPAFDELWEAASGDPLGPVIGPLFGSLLSPAYRIGLALPTLAAAALADEAPLGLDLRDLAAQALETVDRSGGATQTWGERHVFAPVHALAATGLPVPGADAVPRPGLDGDNDCVRATVSYPALSDACGRGSVARYVWDLSDRARSGWVVPLGADGRLDGPHGADQTAAWAAGELLPVVLDWEALSLTVDLR